MSAKKVKIKTKKIHKLIFPSVFAVIFFALLFFVFFQNSPTPVHGIFVSSENPKQGDTVLIKISGEYNDVSGSFDSQNLSFFRNGNNSDWFCLLGIDADQKPGQYKILVNIPGELLEKEINVLQKDFQSVGMVIPKNEQEKGFTPAKIVSNIRNKDNPDLEGVTEKFSSLPNFTGPFTFPLVKMKISGLGFGEFIRSANYRLQHFGDDLRAETGTKVYAVNSGKVVLAKELLNYGNTVVIDHGLGIFSLYLHLSKFNVAPGQNVKKDQVIGLSGSTGFSSGPHLHFSIRDNNTRVDPVLFIKASEKTNDNSNLADISESIFEFFGIDPGKF